jgi:predicted HicB family RNase H-like nuclease
MNFDPESYTITIRKEECYGEILYVGRVAEFPNINAFEETYEEAHALILDAIQTLKKLAGEACADFPLPYPTPSDEFSGRVTLRLSKSLHAKVSRIAAQEDISVNQFLVTAIASYVGETDGISKVVSGAATFLEHVITNAVTNVIDNVRVNWIATKFKQSSLTPYTASQPTNLWGNLLLTYPETDHIFTEVSSHV